MADDAGALLVRSGLVSSSALEDARARAAELGGTLGEQLVAAEAVADDKLTEFYRQRLLVPQVNPNSLARLPAKIVALIPAEMAVELRAIPVSLDNDNNLTVAMSDPSDRRAVDEIAFFTGTYVVRAVATQMQIAWCLAHYYGHVTDLGQRLVKADVPSAPRPKSITDQVRESRHKRIERGELAIDVSQLRAPGERAARSDDLSPDSDTPRPRARTASGEIRVPSTRASTEIPIATGDFDQIRGPEHSGPIITIEAQPSIDSGPVITVEPSIDSGPVISVEPAVDSGPVITVEPSVDSGPVITIESPSTEDITARSKPAPRPVPKRRKPAAPDPPELAARAGEVQLATGVAIKKIDFEEPSIMISEELERALRTPVSGELTVREVADSPPSSPGADLEDNSTVVVREQIHDEKSEPILLERRRPSDAPASAVPMGEIVDAPSDVIELAQKKGPKRVGHITQVGIGVVPAVTRPRADGVPSDELEDQSTDVRATRDDDPTKFDTFAAPPADDYTSTSEELLAAPPSPYFPGPGSGPIALPPPASAAPQPSGRVRLDRVQRAPTRNDEDDEEDDAKSKPTMVMSAIELDAVIPGRSSDVIPAHLVKQTAEETDDGWGPPGTTIPPPLLGAIPGAIEPRSGIIPLPDVDSAPLMVAPPSAPEPGARPHTISEMGLARALEEATARVLELIHTLDHTTDRDQVIAVLIAHLAESHHRAGFFAARGGELSLFAIMPRMSSVPAATLRLDRPSTLQDVVGTRLPYRGPMHDEASRMFLQATLGACPAELLLVPIAVRERTVGVLFGEHRTRHTFDDQLALAARAAGMALERILKARRS